MVVIRADTEIKDPLSIAEEDEKKGIPIKLVEWRDSDSRMNAVDLRIKFA